jgi:hypothetical protein
MIPELQLGVVLLANTSRSVEGLGFKLLDLAAGRRPTA